MRTLDEAIKKAEAAGTGAYIEVVTEKYAASHRSFEVAMWKNRRIRSRTYQPSEVGKGTKEASAGSLPCQD
jgi:hypothetical protein